MLSPVDRNHTDVMQNHTYNNVQCCLMSSFFLVDELLQIWPKRPRGLEDELMIHVFRGPVHCDLAKHVVGCNSDSYFYSDSISKRIKNFVKHKTNLSVVHMI